MSIFKSFETAGDFLYTLLYYFPAGDQMKPGII